MEFRDLNCIRKQPWNSWNSFDDPWGYFINNIELNWVHYIYQVEVSSENIQDLDFIWYILTEPHVDGGKRNRYPSYQYKRPINIITMEPEIFFRMKELNMVFKEVDNISLKLTRKLEGDSIAEEVGSLSSDMAGSMCFQFPKTIDCLHKVAILEDGDNIIFCGFADRPQVIISRNEEQIYIGKKLEKLVNLNINNLQVDKRELHILNYFFDMGAFRRFPEIRDQIDGLNFIYTAYYGPPTIDSAI